MSDSPRRRQQSVHRPRLSDVWYLSYELPRSHPFNSHGPLRGEIEVHVHPGATNFQLVSTRDVMYRPGPPIIPQYSFWPPLGRPAQQVTTAERHQEASGDNILIHSDSASISPRTRRRLLSGGDQAPVPATSNPTMNVPEGERASGGILAYRQSLARVTAAEQSNRPSTTTAPAERLRNPSPFVEVSSAEEMVENLGSILFQANDDRYEYTSSDFLHPVGATMTGNGLGDAAGAEILPEISRTPSPVLPSPAAPSGIPLRNMLLARLERSAATFSAALGNVDSLAVSNQPHTMASLSASGSQQDLATSPERSARGLITRLISVESFPDTQGVPDMLQESTETAFAAPSIPELVISASEQLETEDSLHQNQHGARDEERTQDFIYILRPHYPQLLLLENILPPTTLTQIAQDPNIRTRSFASDVAPFGYTEANIPYIHQYRYRLYPEGNVGVHTPAAAAEAEQADRRETGHDEAEAQAADTVRDTESQHFLDAMPALPAEVEMPSSSPLVATVSSALIETEDIIHYQLTFENPCEHKPVFLVTTSLYSPLEAQDILSFARAATVGSSQQDRNTTITPTEAESDDSETSQIASSSSDSPISSSRSDYIDGIMDVPRGRMGCSCPECNGTFSFL